MDRGEVTNITVVPPPINFTSSDLLTPFTQTLRWMLPPPPLAVGLQTYPTSLKPPIPSPADYSTPPSSRPFRSPTKLLLPAVEAAVMIVCER